MTACTNFIIAILVNEHYYYGLLKYLLTISYVNEHIKRKVYILDEFTTTNNDDDGD